MRRPPRTASAIARFSAGSLAAIAVVLIGSFLVLRSVTTGEAETQVRAQVQLEARLVEAAGLDDGVLTEDGRALARLDKLAVGRLLKGPTVRVKLWSRSGQILYSDEPRLIGRQFGLGPDELALFDHGGADAQLSDLTAPENQYERQEGQLLEAHTVIRTPGGTPVLFETYQRFSSITDNGARLLRAVAPPLVGGLLVLLLFQVPLAISLARGLQRGHAEREGLLEDAIAASDAERRRIASDLHDGVVQDLAGVAFGLAPLADAAERRGATQEASVLRDAADRLRQGIRGLRTLLVEIHPPTLESAGLEAALADLLSPLGAGGIDTELRVEPVATRHDALIYRVAREAIRNAQEHGEPASVRVAVEGDAGGQARLVVRDDGRGFDAGERARRGAAGHVGLTLLEGLVVRSGGTLAIRSEAGTGTVVELEVV